jgi:arsenate reductase
MAQAFAERAGIEARSAGTWPSPELHPEVVVVMRELGIDISGREPHKVATEDVEWADLVVKMGCGDECPVVAGTVYVDWDIQDPMGMPMEVVRSIRDQIEGLVEELR